MIICFGSTYAMIRAECNLCNIIRKGPLFQKVLFYKQKKNHFPKNNFPGYRGAQNIYNNYKKFLSL